MTFKCDFCNKPYVVEKESDKDGCLYFKPCLEGLCMSREYWRVACPSCSALMLSGMLEYCLIEDYQRFNAFIDDAMEKYGVVTNIDNDGFQALNDRFLIETNANTRSIGPGDFTFGRLVQKKEIYDKTEDDR